MRFSTIQHTFFFGLLITVSLAFFWLISDFIYPIFWAIVLAILFYPLHKKLLARTKKHPSLASILSILIITLVIILPLFFIGSMVVSESISYYQAFSSQQSLGEGISILDRLVEFSGSLESFGISQERVSEYVTRSSEAVSSWLASFALTFGQNLLKIALLFFLMLYLLFFVLRDGNRLEARLLKVLPLGDRREKRLIARFVSTTRATMKGTFVIALIQGTIGGFLFFFAGISAPALWGTVMAIASIVPAVGPSIVWFPAGIILLVTGNIWQGSLVLAGGLIIVSLVDNLLRPPLVGRDTQMPDILVLISTLGGISLFGISGFIIGPVIAAFFLTMWQIFEEEYESELSQNG